MKKITSITKEIPKKEIIKVVETFGLSVDRDRWDDDPELYLQYLRVEDETIEYEPLIIYRKDFQLKKLSDVMPLDIDGLKKACHDYLLELGEERLRIKLKKLLYIN